jgi:hypothetical protein
MQRCQKHIFLGFYSFFAIFSFFFKNRVKNWVAKDFMKSGLDLSSRCLDFFWVFFVFFTFFCLICFVHEFLTFYVFGCFIWFVLLYFCFWVVFRVELEFLVWFMVKLKISGQPGLFKNSLSFPPTSFPTNPIWSMIIATLHTCDINDQWFS